VGILLDVKKLIAKILNNRVVLFDNDNQSMSGAITLSESASNFEMLTICYRSNDGTFASADVYRPNNKKVNLWVALYVSGGMYLKTKDVIIEGNTINTYKGSVYVTGQGYIPNPNVASGDYIAITQVIGYRTI